MNFLAALNTEHVGGGATVGKNRISDCTYTKMFLIVPQKRLGRIAKKICHLTRLEPTPVKITT